jgi:hypothetical protein
VVFSRSEGDDKIAAGWSERSIRPEEVAFDCCCCCGGGHWRVFLLFAISLSQEEVGEERERDRERERGKEKRTKKDKESGRIFRQGHESTPPIV